MSAAYDLPLPEPRTLGSVDTTSDGVRTVNSPDGDVLAIAPRGHGWVSLPDRRPLTEREAYGLVGLEDLAPPDGLSSAMPSYSARPDGLTVRATRGAAGLLLLPLALVCTRLVATVDEL